MQPLVEVCGHCFKVRSGENIVQCCSVEYKANCFNPVCTVRMLLPCENVAIEAHSRGACTSYVKSMRYNIFKTNCFLWGSQEIRLTVAHITVWDTGDVDWSSSTAGTILRHPSETGARRTNFRSDPTKFSLLLA